MKTIFLTLTLCVFVISGFTQNATSKTRVIPNAVTINVPNFADPATKQFYEAYTSHIEKAVTAIRHKDEAAFMKLTEEGKKLEKKFEYYMSEKQSTPDDIKKKHTCNKQAMPYIQEIIQSDFNKKVEKN